MKHLKKITLLILLLGLAGLGYWVVQPILSLDSLQFDAWLQQYSWYSPLVIIGFIVIETIIVPLAGGWLSIATGYIYGPWLGFGYAYLGNVLGGYIVFEIARYFSSPLHHRMDSFKNKLSGYKLGLIACYAIPLFPFKLVSLALGVTGLSRRRFFISISLGLIPNLIILNTFGDAIGAPEYQFVLIGLMVVLSLYFILRWMATATNESQQTHNLK